MDSVASSDGMGQERALMKRDKSKSDQNHLRLDIAAPSSSSPHRGQELRASTPGRLLLSSDAS